MASFTDPDRHEWRLTLTVGSLKEIRERAGIDLGQAMKGASFAELLFEEPDKIVRLLWILCEKQAEKLGIEPEAFGACFDGPTLQAAVDALLECIIDFFQRPALAKAMKSRLKPALDKVIQMAGEKLEEALSPERMDSILSGTAGSSPASAV